MMDDGRETMTKVSASIVLVSEANDHPSSIVQFKLVLLGLERGNYGYS